MITFRKFTLQDTIPHRNTRVEFKNGVHVVRGKNFSGKSSMWLLLGQLVTGELPYTQKREKDNQGQLHLSFDLNKVYCEIVYDLAKGRPTTLIENGRELHYRKAPDMTTKLEEWLPFTLASWQNSSYLSNDTFPYLLRGSPLQRKQLFEALFDIDTSKQFKYFKRMDDHLSTIAVKRETLRGIDVQPTSRLDLRKLEDRITVLEGKRKKLEARFAIASDYAQAAHVWEKAVNSGDLPASITTKIGDLTITELKERLVQLDPSTLYDELEDAKAFEAYKQDERERKQLQAKLAAVNSKLKTIKVKVEFTSPQCQLLLRLFDKYGDVLEKYEHEPAGGDIEYMEAQQHKLERRIGALEHASNCPLCGSSLQGKVKTTTLGNLKSELKDIQNTIQQWEALEDEGVNTIARKLRDICISWEDARKWVFRVGALTWAVEAHDLAGRISELPESKQARPTRSVEAVRKDVDNCKHETAAVMARINLLKAGKVYDEENRHAMDVDKLESELTETREKINTLQRMLAEQTVEYRKYRDISKQVSECNHALRIKPAVEVLRNLYGPKGLRASRVRDAVEYYIDNLNDVAQDVLPEYRFFVEHSDSGISLMCERPSGTSDIRRFSGAEGKLLPLLSLLALHPLLPDNKLTNVLILDEPEQGMRADTRQLFTNELVPRLQKCYPSLWVVTPLEASEFPLYTSACDVYEYATAMRDGESSLVAL